jgi:hypothetical protein
MIALDTNVLIYACDKADPAPLFRLEYRLGLQRKLRFSKVSIAVAPRNAPQGTAPPTTRNQPAGSRLRVHEKIARISRVSLLLGFAGRDSAPTRCEAQVQHRMLTGHRCATLGCHAIRCFFAMDEHISPAALFVRSWWDGHLRLQHIAPSPINRSDRSVRDSRPAAIARRPSSFVNLINDRI